MYRQSFHHAGAVAAVLALLVLLAGCDEDSPTEPDQPDGPGGVQTFTFTFEESNEGWIGDFVDYSAGRPDADLELVFDRRPLPDEVQQDGMALYLAGRNLSDDLFMFLKRQITDLQANTTYAITYDLSIASDAGSGCAGIGGPPGEAVFLKVGAADVEPVPVVEEDDYRLNVDKGNQSQGGAAADVIGNVANGLQQCTDTPYRMIERNNLAEPLMQTTGSDGSLWIFVGTDSGFEGTTALYYDRIEVTLEPQ